MSEQQEAQIALYEAQVRSIERAVEALNEVSEFVEIDIVITTRRLETARDARQQEIAQLQAKVNGREAA